MTKGSLILPQNSDYEKNKLFIRDYVINPSVYYGGGTAYTASISDIPNDSIITRVSLVVNTPYAEGSNPTFSISVGEEAVLTQDYINFEEKGIYSTDCFVIAKQNPSNIFVSINVAEEEDFGDAIIVINGYTKS